MMGALLALAVAISVASIAISQVHANVTVSNGRPVPSTWQRYQFFATSTAQTNFATTTTATSTTINAWYDSNGQVDNGYFVIAGAKKVNVYFSRGDTNGQGNAGSSTYSVQVTGKTNPTEADWLYFTKLVPATTTTQVGAGVIAAATSTIGFGLDIDSNAFYAIRCIVVEATDGEHTCAASAQY